MGMATPSSAVLDDDIRELAGVVPGPTGEAAGYNAEQVGGLAQKYSELSGVDDEVIQSAENVMLTFTDIGHETFPQAMEAAMNMSEIGRAHV